MKPIIRRLAKSKVMAKLIFAFVLLGLKLKLERTAGKFPAFRDRLKEKDLTAQIKLKDNSRGRYYTLKGGRVTSKSGIHPNPDVTIFFKNITAALETLVPPKDQLAITSAMKSFQIGIIGPEELTSWWAETLSVMVSMGAVFGLDVGNGVTRYTSNTEGGPVFVYVKDGKIIRITPMEFDDDDAGPWTIKARGRSFTPPRRTTITPFTQLLKSFLVPPA